MALDYRVVDFSDQKIKTKKPNKFYKREILHSLLSLSLYFLMPKSAKLFYDLTWLIVS